MEPAGLEQILRAARQRDPQALTRLVDIFSARVYGLLYRLTGRRDVADDLLQETFLRVVRTIDEYQHDGRFEAWLFRIAANLARDQQRRLRRRGPTVELGEVDFAAGRPGAAATGRAEPAEQLVRSEAGLQLQAGLARLSEPEREIIMLRHFSELSFQEIADLLGVPLGTALARAHRALQKLKRELATEEV